MAGQLERTGHAVHRVPAVDGRLVSAETKVDRRLYRRRHGRDVRPGEIGCYLSHLAAMQAFLATDAEHALILEDDATLLPALPDVLARAIFARNGRELGRSEARKPPHGFQARPAAALADPLDHRQSVPVHGRGGLRHLQARSRGLSGETACRSRNRSITPSIAGWFLGLAHARSQSAGRVRADENDQANSTDHSHTIPP